VPGCFAQGVCVVKGNVLLAAAMVFLILISYCSARADVVFASFNGVYGAADRRGCTDVTFTGRDARAIYGGSGDAFGVPGVPGVADVIDVAGCPARLR
jgi:hypothetical protein